MARSKNIKRAKLLRQRKKEMEKGMEKENYSIMNDKLEKDKQILRDKAARDHFTIIDRSISGRKEKISTVLLEMILPLLSTAQDEEDAKGIVSMGVAAWNCGIIKQTIGEEKLREVLKELQSDASQDQLNLFDEYISIKCNNYGQYNDFITDFRISFEKDGRMNFTVLTGVKNSET